MVRGEPIVELDESIQIDVNANIVAPIARGVIGMLRDIYAQNSESPFVLSPTPVVDLPDVVSTELSNYIRDNTASILESVGYDTQAASTKIDGLKAVTLRMEQERAAKAATKLTTLVQDALIDAEWSKAFEHDAIQHFVMFPTVTIKAPVYKTKKVKVWNGNRYDAETRVVLGVECISPFNIYPSPDATDAQNAEYIIERRRITNDEFYTLSANNGYDLDGLTEVIDRHPHGYIEEYENGAETEASLSDGGGDSDKNPTMCYDAIGYFGKVAGSSLVLYGIEGVSENRNYEAEIWTVGDVVIKAILNPDVLGRRPFYSTSFEPIPNSFWGECPVTRCTEYQRACTSAIAHLFRNLSFSSGPFIEREINRLADDQDENAIGPYEVVDVKASPNGSNARVHTFVETQSHVTEFMNIFDKFKSEAYESIGIPKALFGGTDNMGAIGRTTGGIAAVYAQAGKAIKYSMRLLEECIIEPVIQRITDDILNRSEDASIKGDVMVRARGVSGIAEKENRRNDMNWAMQSLVPMMQIRDANGAPVIPPEAPVRLLYEQFKALGIDTTGVFAKDYDTEAAVMSDVGKPPEVVAQPQMDGRSQAGIDAVASIGGAQFNQAQSPTIDNGGGM